MDTARRSNDVAQVAKELNALDGAVAKALPHSRGSTAFEYGSSIVKAVLIALLLRTFIVEAFKIPSGSMIPTLEIGDHLFVNKFIYGVRIPWTRTKLFAKEPKRGDVIVFIFPKEQDEEYKRQAALLGEEEARKIKDKDFIKRVVAISGDRVKMEDNQIFINDEAIDRRTLNGHCAYEDLKGSLPNDWEERECSGFIEKNGQNTYRIIQNPQSEFYGSPAGDMPERTIPEGTVFVMGDNRDNSHDSRYWGTVPISYIKGKAMFTWFSRRTPEEFDIKHPLNGVRWSRFFNRIHGMKTSETIVSQAGSATASPPSPSTATTTQ